AMRSRQRDLVDRHRAARIAEARMPTVAVRVDGDGAFLSEGQRVLLLIIRHDGLAGHREADQSPGRATKILSDGALGQRASGHPDTQSKEGSRHNSSCASEGVFPFHVLLQLDNWAGASCERQPPCRRTGMNATGRWALGSIAPN